MPLYRKEGCLEIILKKNQDNMSFILGDRLITLSKEYQRLYMKLLIIR